MERVIEHSGEIRSRPLRAEQVWPAHVADEERVARQHGLRLLRGGAVEHENRDGLGRVPGRLEETQRHRAHPDLVALGNRRVGERRSGLCAEVDLRTGSLGQLPVPRHEIRVEVRLDDVPDRQALRFGLLEVGLDVPPRVDDSRFAVRPDHVGRLRQATEIELLEEHHVPLYFYRETRG